MNIQSLFDAYVVEHVQRRVVAADRIGYAWQNLEPHFGALAPEGVTQAEVDAYVDERLKVAQEGTVRREVSLLLTVLRHAARTRRIPMDAVPHIILPAMSPPRRRFLEAGEHERLLELAAAGRQGGRLARVERFVWIALETGARKSSIEALRWDQVDLTRGLIDYGSGNGKKRKAIVPISSRLRPVLERALAERTSEFVLDHPGSIRKAYATLVKRAGLEDVHPHDLRRTFATRAVQAGVSFVDVSRVLGNTAAVVERTYAQYSPEFLRDAVEKAYG